MPRREDIERFTRVLNSLGDEPAIRAARSETIEEVPAPGEESAPGEEPGSAAAGEFDSLGESGAAGESESLQDLFESLSGLPEEAAPGQEEARGAELPEADAGSTAAESAEQGLDFASLFGEEAAPEGIEELDRPAPARETADEEEFSFPGGEPQNLQADLSAMETLPDETVPGPADLEAPQAGEAAGAERFELPNLEDLSFSEPVEGAPAEQAEPSFDEPVLGEPSPSFDAPLPSPETPDLSEAAAPAEEGPIAGLDLDAAAFESAGGSGADQIPAETAGLATAPAEEA